MTDLPNSFVIDGVRLFPGTEPFEFLFLPDAPRPERDANGRPTVSLWTSGRGGRLQLGAQWAVDAATLASLPRMLQRRFPALMLQQIRLSPAPIRIKEVILALGDGNGTWATLASSSSSGFGNYNAIFAAPLTSTQQEQAVAALHGREQFLQVVYCGTLAHPVACTVAIRGDVQDMLDQLGSAPTSSECRQQIDQALAAEELVLERSGGDGAPAELWAKAEQAAGDKAAQALQELAAARSDTWWSIDDKEATIDVSASIEAELQLPVECGADVGTWFADGSGGDHITVLATDLPEPQPQESAENGGVHLTFDPTDAPVAFVELARGTAKATLRGPSFTAVALPANASGPLLVKTHYTQGGAAFESQIDALGASGWALTLANLGLAEVVIDAAAPKQAGAREARVRVRYHPSGDGDDDDRTVYLRRDTWSARWFLITRATGLGGSLEVEWRETAADGKITMHKPITLDTTEITL